MMTLKTRDMEFGEAMEAAKLGLRVRRPGYAPGCYIVGEAGQLMLKLTGMDRVPFQPAITDARSKQWMMTK
jgi:hypothetical protein